MIEKLVNKIILFANKGHMFANKDHLLAHKFLRNLQWSVELPKTCGISEPALSRLFRLSVVRL